MAHYARSTPPVRPPGRPSAPDQPWTGWWQPAVAVSEPSAQDVVAPVEVPAYDLPTAAGLGRPDTHVTPVLDAATGHAPEPPVSVDAMDRGGLRRVGVPPSGAPIEIAPVAAADPIDAEPVLPANPGMLETAATRTLLMPVEAATGADFTVEGVALRTGDLVFVGVTFPQTLAVAPDPSAIQLTIAAAVNADLASVAVADFDGFGPDRVGFTLIAAALNPGAMWVDGHYHVEL
jgi:hypothetical protein